METGGFAVWQFRVEITISGKIVPVVGDPILLDVSWRYQLKGVYDKIPVIGSAGIAYTKMRAKTS